MYMFMMCPIRELGRCVPTVTPTHTHTHTPPKSCVLFALQFGLLIECSTFIFPYGKENFGCNCNQISIRPENNKETFASGLEGKELPIKWRVKL